MASGDSIQLIKDKINIIDVISPYTELQKSGRHFVARCPFHSEKTPSFHVSVERGTFHCFGCGVGGDIFSFTQLIDGVDFKESLKTLANKAGVELIPENPQKKSERDQLYAVLEAATQYFENNLVSHGLAQAYLEERGVVAETLKKWRIGYAPGPSDGGWRELRQYLTVTGFNDTILQKAGLIKTTSVGKEPFDVFRDRIMFPLRDQTGKVVAFSGRLLAKMAEAPKYVNSPETYLYHKSDLLYGYDMAKHSIRSLGFWLIVEGQFDVVMSHQAGYGNTVAVSGTALTVNHVQLLERLSTKVVLALDADKAGITAMKKSADLMLRRGIDVKVASLPDGTDPADMIVIDPKAYKHAIGQSMHVIEFLLHHLRQTVTDNRTFKLRAREEVIPFVTLIPNHIDREHFEGVIATALGTTKDAVHFEVTRLEEEGKRSTVTTTRSCDSQIDQVVTNTKPNRKESALLYLVAASNIVKSDIKSVLTAELSAITDLNIEILTKALSASELQKTIFQLETVFEAGSDLQIAEDLAHTLERLRRVSLDEQLAALRQQINETSGADQILMDELLRLQKQKQIPAYNSNLFIFE